MPQLSTDLIHAVAIRDRLATLGVVRHDAAVGVPQPVGNGQSNLTYALDVGERRVVVRRPPRPPFHASAHDVLREARVLAALAGTAVPVPAVLAVIEDHVDGVPAVITEFLEGDVVADTLPPRLTAASLAELGRAAAEVLAAIHELPASRFTHVLPSGDRQYLERQLDRYARIATGFDGSTRALADHVEARLKTGLPAPIADSLVHGDLRLGNVLWAPVTGTEARLEAVLDWELAALGDPDADLAYLLMAHPDPVEARNPISDMAGALLNRPDRPTRRDLARWYAQKAGRKPRRPHWFAAFVRWRAAIGLEFFRLRGARGEIAGNAWLASLVDGVPAMLDQAASYLDKGQE